MSFLLLIFLGGNIFTLAQQRNPTASFETEIHDFGSINESDGLAAFRFTFTNTGGDPLILKNVQASCGCTTPNWSKEPVLPGAKGFINVTYNPKGRPGRFEKVITVTSNGDPETQQLKIMGTVVPKQPTIEESYPILMDGLRMKTSQIAFNNISNDKKSIQNAEVYNSTDQPIKVAFTAVPKHISLKLVPDLIPPKGKGNVEITYDAAAKNDWGFVVDYVSVVVNDKNNSNNRISVVANIQEDFSQLSEEQKKNAPKIEFDNLNFEFGVIKPGEKADHEYLFKNTGKSDLIIRKVTPSCGCTVATLKNSVIKPGESSGISASFNSTGKSGNQSKTITVITNDPTNQHLVLWIKGNVQQ